VDLLYTLHSAPLSGPGRTAARQVGPEGVWAELVGEEGPVWLVAPGDDAWTEAVRGLWAVLAAERPDRHPATLCSAQPLPQELAAGARVTWEGGWQLLRLRRVSEPLGAPPALQVRAAGGEWSEQIARAVSDRPGAEPISVLPVEPPPDLPLRSLDPRTLQRQVQAALDSLERRAGGRMLVVTSADGLAGRPLGGPSAAVAGAAGAWARARGAPVLRLGPLARQDTGPRRLGVAALGPSGIRRAVYAAASGSHTSLVAMDVEWGEALAAFPHLGPLAAELARGPDPLQIVRDEVARILHRPQPPVDRALRDLGMDSQMLEELRVSLEARLRRSLPAAYAFEHPTIEAIARSLRKP
jgi:hypothetical protein